MNHSDKNEKKKKPSPIEPSSKQNDDNDKSDHNENSIESANSTKSGAVTAYKSVYASKTMQKTDVQSKYNALFYRAIALPGHYPINEEPGYDFMKKNGNQEKMAKKIAKDALNQSSKPGAVKVKDIVDSNMKGKKKLRTQMYERKAATESKSSFKRDNKNTQSQINFGSTNIASSVREIPALSSHEVPFANEERAHSVITTSSNEEETNYIQERGFVHEGYDNYEMPIATTVNDGEGSLVLPHAEPNDLEDDVLVIVDAEVIYFVLMYNIVLYNVS